MRCIPDIIVAPLALGRKRLGELILVIGEQILEHSSNLANDTLDERVQLDQIIGERHKTVQSPDLQVRRHVELPRVSEAARLGDEILVGSILRRLQKQKATEFRQARNGPLPQHVGASFVKIKKKLFKSVSEFIFGYER
jgi:hypothetical protein